MTVVVLEDRWETLGVFFSFDSLAYVPKNLCNHESYSLLLVLTSASVRIDYLYI